MQAEKPQPARRPRVVTVVNRRLAGVLASALAIVFAVCATMAFADSFVGTSGPDQISGTPAPDQLYGEDGDDALDGLAGADYIEGGPGADQMTAGPGADLGIGGTGNDRLD